MMKQILPALFLLAAVACAERFQSERMYIIDYQRNDQESVDHQHMKPISQSGDMSCDYRPPHRGPYNERRPRTTEYVLSFDWAPRTRGICYKILDTSHGLVKMGSQIITKLSPGDGNTGVRHEEFTLNLEKGDQTLVFEGTGRSDSLGISVSNVVLRRKDSTRNILVNADFSYPNVGVNRIRYFVGGINGWTANIAEIGDCRFYNTDWKGGQCIDLDSNKNEYYAQKFRVETC